MVRLLSVLPNTVPSSFLAAEALAIRKAYVCCLKAGLNQVIIKSGNATVVDFCVSNFEVPSWEVKAIIEDIRFLFLVKVICPSILLEGMQI